MSRAPVHKFAAAAVNVSMSMRKSGSRVGIDIAGR
jgi:hypothetical protein